MYIILEYVLKFFSINIRQGFINESYREILVNQCLEILQKGINFVDDQFKVKLFNMIKIDDTFNVKSYLLKIISYQIYSLKDVN